MQENLEKSLLVQSSQDCLDEIDSSDLDPSEDNLEYLTNINQSDTLFIESVIGKNEDSMMDALLDNIIRQEGNNNLSVMNSCVNESIVHDEDESSDIGATETFQLRNYQLELYHKGKGNNSIIFLETGTGKTLVVMMMMYHQLCNNPQKRVVFLANTVILVEQQGKQIKLKLPRVAELLENEYPNINYKSFVKMITKKISIVHGNKGMDYWSVINWKSLYEDTMVFVMTPQILLNCLRKGTFNIKDFSCLIFDECHSALHNHAYNNIMKEFYFQNKIKDQSFTLPVIIGTTASPASKKDAISKQVITKNLLYLGANLNSTFLHVELSKLQQYLKEAKLQFTQYDPLFGNFTNNYIDYYNKDSRQIIIDTMNLNNYCSEFFKIMQFFYSFYKNQEEPYPLFQQIFRQIYHQLINKGLRILIDLGEYSYALLLEDVIQILYAYIQSHPTIALSETKIALEFLENQEKQIKNRTLNIIDGCNDKLKKVLNLLKQDLYKDQFNKSPSSLINVSLIFVKTRNMAEYLSKTLNKFLILHGVDKKIKANFILGRNQQGDSKKILTPIEINHFKLDESIEDQVIKLKIQIAQDYYNDGFQNLNRKSIPNVHFFKKGYDIGLQMKTIEQFRTQKIQILVSTSVAEEGLDVPMCNFVINYNILQSTKAFVQIKGRARQENSRFIIMIPKESVRPFLQIKQEIPKVKAKEKLQMMTRQSVAELSSQEEVVRLEIKKIQKQQLLDNFYEQYVITSSGAVINTNWSMILITQFCYLFMTDKGRQGFPVYTVTKIPKNYQKCIYIAHLLLPQNLKALLFQGNFQESEISAKQSAALNASIYLYTEGYLDDNLTPLYQKDYGQYLGTHEDDINILQTQEYQEIMKKRSKQLIYQKQTGLLLTLRTVHNYYHQLNANSLRFKDKSRIFKIPIQIKNQFLHLICDEKILHFLVTQKYILSLYDINAKTEPYEELSILPYENARDHYQQDMIKYDCPIGQYMKTQKNIRFCFFIQESHNDGIIVEALSLLIQAKKLYNLSQRLTKQQQDYTKGVNMTLSVIQENYILKNLEHFQLFFTALVTDSQQSLQKQQKFKSTTNLEQIPISPIVDLLDALKNSIDVENLNPIITLVGRKLYGLIVSMQIYFEFISFDQEMIRTRYKRFVSSTHVKYQLTSESEMFMYLHSSDKKNTMSYIPGIHQNLNNLILDNDSLIITEPEEFKKIELRYHPHYVHLTTGQISKFFYHVIGYTHHVQDEKFQKAIDFIQSTGVLKSDQFKNLDKILQVNDFLDLNRLLYIERMDSQYLKAYYIPLQDNLGYNFKRFTLLFQSLTNPSFRTYINKHFCPSYSRLETKDKPIIEMSIDMLKQLEGQIQSLSLNQINYCNDHLAYFGERVYIFISTQILQKMKKYKGRYIYFRTALKILTSTPIISYLSVKIQLPFFINSDNTQELSELNAKMNLCDQNNVLLILKTLQQPGNAIRSLRQAFFAIIGAIYIDSNADLAFMQIFVQNLVFEKYGLGLVFDQYVTEHPRFRFYEWYDKEFGNLADFELIKVPHCNYAEKLYHNLYIPFDFKKGEIVNILKEKLQVITQLHFYAQYKRRAWNQVFSLLGLQ